MTTISKLVLWNMTWQKYGKELIYEGTMEKAIDMKGSVGEPSCGFMFFILCCIWKNVLGYLSAKLKLE